MWLLVILPSVTSHELKHTSTGIWYCYLFGELGVFQDSLDGLQGLHEERGAQVLEAGAGHPSVKVDAVHQHVHFYAHLEVQFSFYIMDNMFVTKTKTLFLLLKNLFFSKPQKKLRPGQLP